MITTDKILKEYFFTREDGGACFDVTNYNDLQEFESFLLETGYINDFDRAKLNELFGVSKTDVSKGASFLKNKISSLWNNVADLIKSGYRQLTNQFKRQADKVGNTIGIHKLDDTFYVIIPSLKEPNLRDFERTNQEIQAASSGGGLDEDSKAAETSFKGYYNEALTALYVVKKNKTPVQVKMIKEVVGSDDDMIVVQLENEKSAEVINIFDEVKRLDAELKKATGTKYDDVKKDIEMASKDMADYLINTVGTGGGIILEVYLTGKKEMGISKADIRLKIKKGVKQSFRAWSLKMYQGRNVTLLNSTLKSAIEKICGPEFVPKLNQLIASNEALKIFKAIRLSAKRIKNAHKNKDSEGRPRTAANPAIDAATVIKRLGKYCLPLVQRAGKVTDRRTFPHVTKDAILLYNEAIKNIKSHPNDYDAIQEDIRIVRDVIGNGTNPHVAQIVAELMKYCLESSDTNREIFSRNLLDQLGFSDVDTEFLMALVGPKQKKAGKSELVTEHPELDLNNIEVLYVPGQTNLSLVNSVTKDRIVQFSTKEGGGITASVKFDKE
jgi:hypothetical protein